MKPDTATGKVCDATLESRDTNRNSFQDVRKAKMQDAARTALEIGITTRRNTCRELAPSIMAASSISGGISSKKFLITQTTIARAKAEWLVTRAVRVPMRPRNLNTT